VILSLVLRPGFCQAYPSMAKSMAKRLTAAVMLLVIGAWAEMALAPMLLMHAALMRPRHQAAANMSAHSSNHHAPVEMAAHSRCSGQHGPEHPGVEPVIEVSPLLADAPLCDDPHNCCFRQGPQSVPAPASDLQQLARKIAPASRLFLDPLNTESEKFVDEGALPLRAPPNIFGVILRV
jgi:hypothetical protein